MDTTRYIKTDKNYCVAESGRYLGIDVEGGIVIPFAYPENGSNYIWNFETDGWQLCYPVDAQGNLLSKLDDLAVASIVMIPPPSQESTWDKDVRVWHTPPKSDIMEKTVVGGAVIRETYRGDSTHPDALALKAELQRAFPETDMSNITSIGKVKASNFYPEDIITVYLGGVLPDSLRREYGVAPEIIIRAYALKYYLSSKNIVLKILDNNIDNYLLPVLPGGAKILFIGSHYSHTQLDVVNTCDAYFICTDKMIEMMATVTGYFDRLGFICPLSEAPTSTSTVGFGISYDKKTGKVLRVKRYTG